MEGQRGPSAIYNVYKVRPRKDHRGGDLISDAIRRAERERILDGEAVKLTLDCPADVWLLSAVKGAVECHCLCR